MSAFRTLGLTAAAAAVAAASAFTISDARAAHPAAGAPSTAVDSRIEAQSKQIAQLQSRITALEKSAKGGTHPTSAPHAGTPLHTVPVGSRKSIAFKSLAPGLSALSARHLHFDGVRLVPGTMHKYTTAQQALDQVNAISAQLAALQAEVSADETTMASQFAVVQSNLNAQQTFDNSLPHSCTSNGAMSWQSWKSHIGDGLADNLLICFDDPIGGRG